MGEENKTEIIQFDGEMPTVCVLSLFHCFQLSVTPWTIAHQAPLSVGFSRQEYWSELPCPPPGDCPNPGIEPGYPSLQADSLLLSHQGSPKNCLGYNCNNTHETCKLGFPGGSDGKEFTCNAGDLALIPVLGRYPRDRNGYQLQ